MLVKDLLEGYNPNHVCKTPDAMFSTHFHDNIINLSVELPDGIELPDDEDELEDLEAELHYAIEKVLAKLFD